MFLQFLLECLIIEHLILMNLHSKSLEKFVSLRTLNCLTERHDKLVWILLHVTKLILVLQIVNPLLDSWFKCRYLIALLNTRVSLRLACLRILDKFDLLHLEILYVMILEPVHGVVEVFLLWLDSSLSLLLILRILYYFSYDRSELFNFNTVFSDSRRCFLRLLLRTFQFLERALWSRLHVFVFFSSRFHLFWIWFFILTFGVRCIFVRFLQSCWCNGLG